MRLGQLVTTTRGFFRRNDWIKMMHRGVDSEAWPSSTEPKSSFRECMWVFSGLPCVLLSHQIQDSSISYLVLEKMKM